MAPGAVRVSTEVTEALPKRNTRQAPESKQDTNSAWCILSCCPCYRGMGRKRLGKVKREVLCVLACQSWLARLLVPSFNARVAAWTGIGRKLSFATAPAPPKTCSAAACASQSQTQGQEAMRPWICSRASHARWERQEAAQVVQKYGKAVGAAEPMFLPSSRGRKVGGAA